MEYSTESLMFLSDYANSQVVPKNIPLSNEAKEFCEQSEQFVREAKLDPKNDDVEAQIGVTNFMILASNVQHYKAAHLTGEMDLSIMEYKSSDAESLLENRYHFSKRESKIRFVSNMMRKKEFKWLYRIVLILLILALLWFVGSFILGSAHGPQKESKNLWGTVSDFFAYDVFGNPRPASNKEIWEKTQNENLSKIWGFLVLLMLTVIIGFLSRFLQGYIAKQSGICARFHLFVNYMRELENEHNRRMEEM